MTITVTLNFPDINAAVNSLKAISGDSIASIDGAEVADIAKEAKTQENQSAAAADAPEVEPKPATKKKTKKKASRKAKEPEATEPTATEPTEVNGSDAQKLEAFKAEVQNFVQEYDEDGVNGMKKLAEIYASFGYKKTSEVNVEHYPEIVTLLQKALDDEG